MEEFHGAPWTARLAIVYRFSDRRLKQLGRRLMHAERPDLLGSDVRFKLNQKSRTKFRIWC